MPDDQAFYASVGRLTLGWSAIEAAFADLLATLIGAEFPYGHIIIDKINSFDVQSKTIKEVAKHRFGAESHLFQRTDKLLREAKRLKDARNAIAHGAPQLVPVSAPDGNGFDPDYFRVRAGPGHIKYALGMGTREHRETADIGSACDAMAALRIAFVELRGDVERASVS